MANTVISLSNFTVHTHPTCQLSGTVNLSGGTFSLTLTKKTGKYAYNMYIELWLGVPGKSGSKKIKQLIYFNGHNLASSTDAPAKSVSNSGTFTLTASGTYYIVMACEASSCSILGDSSYSAISCSVTEGSKTYKAAAFKATQFSIVQSGNTKIQVTKTTGKSITVTASYSIPSNTFWASTTNDRTNTTDRNNKLYVWLNSDTANAKLVSNASSVTFTGLTNGTSYTIHCGCCENNGNYLTSSCSATTYKTTVTITGHTYTSVSAKISVNNSYSGAIEWWSNLDPTKRTTTNGEIITVNNVASGEDVTITAQPSGIADASAASSDKTSRPTEITDVSVAITGTTCTFTPNFDVGDNGEVAWRATLANQVVSGIGTQPARFEMLGNAGLYTVTFKPLLTDESSQSNITDLSYDIRTYACQLKERACGSNSFTASIFQTFGAVGPEYGYLRELATHQYDAYCTRRDGNIPNDDPNGDSDSYHTGVCTINGQDCRVTGLEPNTSYRLYVWLTDCTDFKGYYDAVGYIDFTTKPVAVTNTFSARVTGRTITIAPSVSKWNGSSQLRYNCYFHVSNKYGPVMAMGYNTCDATSMHPVIATGLQNGTKYYVEINAEDENGNQVEVNDIEVVTYGIEANISGLVHSTYMEDIEVRYTDGERFAGISQDTTRGANVKWYITPRNETGIVDGVETLNCRRSNPTKLTTNKVLSPEVEYTFHAYIDGVVYNGENDTVISFDFDTDVCAKNLSVTTDATGETICVTPTWLEPIGNNTYEMTVTCVVTLDKVIKGVKSTSINGETIWFTGLERGKTYTVSYTAMDNEGNSSSDYITYNNTASGGVVLETTYKLIISDFVYSTKSFKWTCTCNRPIPTGKAIEYYLAQANDTIYNWDRTMLSGGTVSYSNLKHNTQTTLMVRITDMRDRNGNLDTIETIKQYTKKLSVSLADYNSHVKVIDTIWQAMANLEAYDKDPVTGDDIRFVDEMCSCEPVIKGKGKVGIIDGLYATDRTRYFRGLTGGREYIVKIGITDGVNVAKSQPYSIYALIQLIRIYDSESNRFRLALPYIYHNGTWYKAPLYVYHNDKWHDTNPE